MSEKESSRKIVLIFVLAVAFFIGGYLLNKPKDGEIKPEDYSIKEVLYGAKIYSKIPLTDVAFLSDLALYESKIPGALACNLEFSTLKPRPLARVYAIEIEEGTSGVFIGEDKATVRGSNPTEILYNCHVLSCLLSNVTCPDNLDEIKGIMWYTNEFNVILDSTLSAQSMGAYAELMGPLGFYQIMKADLNKDGKLDEREEAANKVFIYPYFKFNDSCRLQPLKNLVQDVNVSENVTRDCDIHPGIYIEEADVNEIKVDGEKIYLRGDSNHLRAEAIIVGNIVAPDWITSFRQAG